jgi:hypothetical protein
MTNATKVEAVKVRDGFSAVLLGPDGKIKVTDHGSTNTYRVVSTVKLTLGEVVDRNIYRVQSMPNGDAIDPPIVTDELLPGYGGGLIVAEGSTVTQAIMKSLEGATK